MAVADTPEVDNVLKPDKEFAEKKIYQRALKKLKAVSEKSKKTIEKIAEKKKEAEKKLEQAYKQLEPYANRANAILTEELRAMGYRGEAKPSTPSLARVQQKEPESAKIDFNEILRSVGSVNLNLGSIDDIVGINEVDYSSVFDTGTKKKSAKKKSSDASISDLVYGNRRKKSDSESKSTDFDLDVSEFVFGKRKI